METTVWDTSPISRLPTEVLVQIFIHNILLLPVQRGHYYRLFNTLFVCWRWHEITISTPSLWCHLESNINLWPLFARRSKTLGLFIHMYDITGQYRMVAQEEFDTMFQDATFHKRIREITFDGDIYTFRRLFDNTLHRPLRLVSLSFTNRFTQPIPPLTPIGFITPCLEKLHISDLDFDLGSIVGTRNLTHLSLVANRHCFGNSGKLLAVLQANPFLEYLRFTRGYCNPPPEHGFSHIPLLHLRTVDMELFWTKSQLSRFFERLELSANIEEIKLTTVTHEKHENLAWILGAVHPAISLGPVRHLLIRESPLRDVAFHYSKYPSDDMSLPQTAPFLILGSDNILESPLHHYLGELGRYNDLSNLSHLEVMIFQWKPHLRPVFEVTKTLEKLTVWTWNHCRGLFDVLHPEAVGGDAGGADNVEEASSTSPARVRLLLPALRELTIIEADFRSSDPDTSRSQLNIAVLNCFRARRQQGSHLEILRLIACHYVHPIWVEELEEVVQEVFWDGLEGGYDSSENGEDYSELTHSQYFRRPIEGSQEPSVMSRACQAPSDHRKRDEGLMSPQSSDDAYSDEERESSESEWTGTPDDEENYFLHDSHLF